MSSDLFDSDDLLGSAVDSFVYIAKGPSTDFLFPQIEI